VICLDLKTGATLWDYLAHEAPPSTSIHLKNSFASETPVVDRQRLYAYFGNLGISTKRPCAWPHQPWSATTC
jgi:hypothetical protein